MTDASTSSVSSTDTIRFVLDGELIELTDIDPTRTVLQFLREDLRRTGTKEGCAEGDCGACTVVVAELNREGDDLEVRAINSCIQFLPTLHGKELITVESLSANGGDLHPVQQALVDCHASQCGFCTPGFVMSLFALYKTNANPTRREIDDALAGNLCRCTGYRPIIAAAQSVAKEESDDWLRQACGHPSNSEQRVARLRSIPKNAGLAITRAGRHFFAPTNVSELADTLATNPDATILAGGTDVGLWVTKQYRELTSVVYTGRVQELLDVAATDSYLEIGAGVTLSDAVPILIEHYPSLEEMLLRFASPPIRNAATLGGNVANGSPIGDSMPALMVLQTSLRLRSATGSRDVLLSDFYRDYRVNDLRAGEFVEHLRVPLAHKDSILRCYKVSKRFDQDISAVCGAYCLRLEGDQVASIRIAYGGMAATVRRANGCEQSLTGKSWNEGSVRQAMQALGEDFAPISDMRSSAGYRLRIAQNLLWRLFLESRGESRTTVYEYGRTG